MIKTTFFLLTVICTSVWALNPSNTEKKINEMVVNSGFSTNSVGKYGYAHAGRVPSLVEKGKPDSFSKWARV